MPVSCWCSTLTCLILKYIYFEECPFFIDNIGRWKKFNKYLFFGKVRNAYQWSRDQIRLYFGPDPWRSIIRWLLPPIITIHYFTNHATTCHNLMHHPILIPCPSSTETTSTLYMLTTIHVTLTYWSVLTASSFTFFISFFSISRFLHFSIFFFLCAIANPRN
jgi:hypothetical protein